jgi:hypothetical protein
MLRKEFGQLLRRLEFIGLNAPNGDTRTAHALRQRFLC